MSGDLREAVRAEIHLFTDRARAEEAADAILAELRKRGALVPEGWKAVPVEPTAAMREAFWMSYGGKQPTGGPGRSYRAMVAAAPAPTTGEG